MINWSDSYAIAIAALGVVAAWLGASKVRRSRRQPRSAWPWISVLTVGLLLGGIGLDSLWLPTPSPWKDPKTDNERKAYEFAHSIVLPASIPRPVPFSFAKARLIALVPGTPSVAEQYHQHLCNTEAGDFPVRQIQNVEGFFQMRPRRKYSDSETLDPSAVESYMGWFAGGWYEALQAGPSGGPAYFVQPPTGRYLFIEQPARNNEVPKRYLRDLTRVDPRLGLQGMQSRNPSTNALERIPFLIAIEDATTARSKYGYTWRGVTRIADRSYWIVGGETIVLELETSKVVGVRRDFVRRTGVGTSKPGRDYWCGAGLFRDDDLFIPLVLKPLEEANSNLPVLK